ncbi:MAG: hypothetical protein ACQEWD_05865 [Bacteroidota bacterium]
MTLHEFRMQSQIYQMELVYLAGKFIDIQLAPPNSRLTLFGLFKFWVEREYDLETKKTIGIKGFTYGKILGSNLS